MSTPFGPRLIGETEKSLNAILGRVLQGTGLSERHWVSLRLADQLGDTDRETLATTIADRAHFPDATQLVTQLTDRGLLEGGRLSADGRDLIASLQTSIVQMTAPIWRDLATDDVAAAERLLNEIVRRSRLVLSVHP